MRSLSFIEFQRVARRYVLPVFGSRRPADITRSDIRSLLERILARGAPTQAKRTLALVRAVFRWSIREDLLPAAADPTFAFSLPNEAKPRDRVYTNDEIRAIFAAVPWTELQDFVPPLFYTGVRSEEARAARWADVGTERAFWTIPAAVTKAGDPHPVPRPVPCGSSLVRARPPGRPSFSSPPRLRSAGPAGGPVTSTFRTRRLFDCEESRVCRAISGYMTSGGPLPPGSPR